MDIGLLAKRIVDSVKVIRILWLLIITATMAMAANGSFVGQVVNGPILDSEQKWIYVQAPKGQTRRVEISNAKVRFAATGSSKNRPAKPEDAIREGVRVRVTASQDGRGEWKATEVEILETVPK